MWRFLGNFDPKPDSLTTLSLVYILASLMLPLLILFYSDIFFCELTNYSAKNIRRGIREYLYLKSKNKPKRTVKIIFNFTFYSSIHVLWWHILSKYYFC